MRALVAALLRASRDLAALDDAVQLLEQRPAGDRALVAEAIAYVRARAVVRPELAARAAALAIGEAADEVPPEVSAPARPRAALERACAWIDDHLARFRGDDLPSIKAIAELAHAGEVLARSADPARGRAWIAHGWAALDGGAVLARRADATAHDALLATVLPPFARAGHACDAVLARMLPQIERSLFSAEEWAYLAPVLRGLGAPVPAVGLAAAARASVLATRPAPWTLGLPAIYQLAHEVFYATAWGARPLDAAAYVRRWMPCWLERYEADADTDVVAELLAAAICAGAATRDESWALLAGAQAADGSVAPPPHRRVDRSAHDDAFARRHHPTLVAVIAWAI